MSDADLIPPRSPMRRLQLRRRVRPGLILLGVSLLITWLTSTIMAFTLNPRRGVAVAAEAWRFPGIASSTTMWRSGFAVYAERTWELGSKRSWGTEQATGAPDTHGQGDFQTAWASATPDSQEEWLTLAWAAPVHAVEVSVYQTYNPGAISRISVSEAGGSEVTVWDASSPGGLDPARAVFVVPIDPPRRIDRVTVTLDSVRVAGWNEIDAVGLRDTSGMVSHAEDATASSNYAERNMAPAAPSEVRLPNWTGLRSPPGSIESGRGVLERRAAGAFGWPLPAWAGMQVIESRTGSGPAFAVALAGPMCAIPFRPVFPGLVINTLIVAAILGVLRLVLFAPLRPARRLLRIQRGLCPQCAYDLRFDFARGCSECGFLRNGADHRPDAVGKPLPKSTV